MWMCDPSINFRDLSNSSHVSARARSGSAAPTAKMRPFRKILAASRPRMGRALASAIRRKPNP